MWLNPLLGLSAFKLSHIRHNPRAEFGAGLGVSFGSNLSLRLGFWGLAEALWRPNFLLAGPPKKEFGHVSASLSHPIPETINGYLCSTCLYTSLINVYV